MKFPSVFIEEAVNEFSKLPGIGRRTAIRLVLFLLNEPSNQSNSLSKAILDLKEKTRECKKCHTISDEEICDYCKNPTRNHQIICIVETIREVMAIENTSQYKGVFHVLGGAISPINGIGPDQLNIESLLLRVVEQDVEEVIMALNPNIDGDTTIFYLSKKLREIKPAIKITTIARGIAFGGELEYVDEITLARSLETRLPFDNYLSNQ